MKKFYLILTLSLTAFVAGAQQVATFEDVELETNSYYNGEDSAGGFFSGGFWFPNDYIADWQYWSGFSVSNMKDTTTPGYGNQYSAITGSGAEQTENYAVVFFPGELKIEFEKPVDLSGFYVTNSTLTYLMMRDGDPNGFSKKFGGEDGKDPDFLKLLIWGTDQSGKPTETVEFYLADFSAENPEKKYIVNDWRWIDLSNIKNITALNFGMESSDVGEYGMNTPAYFCIDNFSATTITSSDLIFMEDAGANVFPNPVKDSFFVLLKDGLKDITLTDTSGRILFQQQVSKKQTLQIPVLKDKPPGIYFLNVREQGRLFTRKVLKM